MKPQHTPKWNLLRSIFRIPHFRFIVHRSSFIVRCSMFIVPCFAFLVSSSWSAGNIDTSDKYAWSSHIGWLNFSPTHGGVTVVKAGAHGYLKGFVWAENVGWIKLGAGDGDGPYANTSSTNWGVNMDAAGNLSGYGWSSHVGWINFSPTHGQVTIAPATGSFDGLAWGENIGWIHFKNVSPQYNVKTVFGHDHPASAKPNWTLLK